MALNPGLYQCVLRICLLQKLEFEPRVISVLFQIMYAPGLQHCVLRIYKQSSDLNEVIGVNMNMNMSHSIMSFTKIRS